MKLKRKERLVKYKNQVYKVVLRPKNWVRGPRLDIFRKSIGGQDDHIITFNWDPVSELIKAYESNVWIRDLIEEHDPFYRTENIPDITDAKKFEPVLDLSGSTNPLDAPRIIHHGLPHFRDEKSGKYRVNTTVPNIDPLPDDPRAYRSPIKTLRSEIPIDQVETIDFFGMNPSSAIKLLESHIRSFVANNSGIKTIVVNCVVGSAIQDSETFVPVPVDGKLGVCDRPYQIGRFKMIKPEIYVDPYMRIDETRVKFYVVNNPTPVKVIELLNLSL